MTDKILVYVNRDLTTFGLANSLQKKYDCKLYSIIEMMDKPTEYFKIQNTVNFEKSWYFFDEVDMNNKPDIEYLKSIEEKYKINLWQIALTERSFLHYNKYHKFSRNEILSILESECKFFEKILDEVNPNFLIVLMTDFQHLRVLYEICKSRKIQVLITKRSRFGFKWMITGENKLQNLTKYLEKPQNKNRTLEELQNYLKNHDPFKLGKELVKKQPITLTKFLTLRGIKSLINFISSNKDRERFYGVGRTRIKIFPKIISMVIKTHQRESFMNKYLLKKLPINEKFVYFPLHDEPEGVIFLSAPFYTNQLEVIKNIAKSIPIDYKLYVKEHPIMRKRRWRETTYYKEILNLVNVRLFHPSVENSKFIKNCSLVTTIAGTTAIEAAFNLKPSISLIDSSYSMLPSVYYLESIENLPQAIKQSLKTKVEISDLNKFVNLMEANSFNFELLSIFTEFHPFHGVVQPNKEITDEIMNLWLNQNIEIFDLWANEMVKKIQIIKSDIS
jgi:hypothetical protein